MTSAYSISELLQTAAEARRHAHAKYSNFRVGAALLANDGTVVQGCNVENASLGLTICAERVALTAAVVTGRREFGALALVTERSAAPCGACRQVLAEFCEDDFPIHIATADDLNKVESLTLGGLLPNAFRF
ncbi:MAG: cytidine deaminase [Opitutales bacterium]|jgi:cytidine deaminase